MRIAIVTSSVSSLGGGVSKVIEELSYHLLNYDAEVMIFSFNDESWDYSDSSAWKGAPVNLTQTIGPKSLGYSPEMLTSLVNWEPDIVHLHGIWMYPSRAVYQWSQKSSGIVCISPHGMLEPWALKNSKIKKMIASILYEKKNLHNAKFIHGLTQSEARDIENYGVKCPIFVIPNGVSHQYLNKYSEYNKKSSDEKKKLLYLGRIHPKKGLSILIKAWKLFQVKVKGAEAWSLEIVGWDQVDHEEQLKRLVTDYSLDDSVKFSGPLFGEDKNKALSYADAFILPSLSEGLPVSVLEAWAFKLPVLMTKECNLSEAYGINAAIEICPEESSILSGLTKLIDLSDHELGLIGENGYNLVRDKYTWERVAEQFMRVYKWSLDQKKMPELSF